MKKAVIFDMDGVIINSEVIYKERREQFFSGQGITLTDEMQRSFIGSNPKAMMTQLFPHHQLKQQEMLANYRAFSKEFKIDTTQLLNQDIVALLDNLKKKEIRLAVASSGNERSIHQTLSTNKIASYFELVVSGESFRESKPHPEIYQQTMKELRIVADDCLAVEDSTHGIQAAVSAGIDVLALEQVDYQVDQSQATHRISSLHEVMNYLSK